MSGATEVEATSLTGAFELVMSPRTARSFGGAFSVVPAGSVPSVEDDNAGRLDEGGAWSSGRVKSVLGGSGSDPNRHDERAVPEAEFELLEAGGGEEKVGVCGCWARGGEDDGGDLKEGEGGGVEEDARADTSRGSASR